MQNSFVDLLGGFGFSPNDRPILVAVSGGVDSMVLLSLFQESGFRVGVAHCNYQLRGAASDRDEEFVRNWCSERNLPFHGKRIDTQKLADEANASIQMVARNERYSFFEELMDSENYLATALAHHADDRIESLLINILRGTGIRGLQGMPSKRDRFIRPLIGFRKDEIRVFAKINHIPFREDGSNSKPDYLRNWVRLRLLPMLKAADAELPMKLIGFCQRVENELPNYEVFMNSELNEFTSESTLDLSKLKSSFFPFTLLKEALEPLGFSSDQVFEVLGILDSESGTEVRSKTHRVLRDRDLLLVEPVGQDQTEPKLRFEAISPSSISSFVTESNVALVNGDRIDPTELKLRKWKEGDRFKPLGMKGWKKLSDFFIDDKLSVPEKEKIWLLTYSNEVVWVIGMRLDDRFKVASDTQKVLKISVFF